MKGECLPKPTESSYVLEKGTEFLNDTQMQFNVI
jgi:hypothetical protein